jgi:hypothetical protein
MANSIIGWDFGTGRPVPLPVDTPQEIKLVAAHPDATAATTPQATTLRIWNLHPMLVAVVTWYPRLRVDKDPSSGPYPPSQLQGHVQGFPIVKTMHPQIPVLELLELPAAEIFQNGGQLIDGCEINSGMQAIELVFTVNLAGPSDHDLVATVQIKQKDPLGCINLAEALINAVRLDIGPTLAWP